MVQFHSIQIKSAEIDDFLKSSMTLREICHQILGQKVVQKTAVSRNIAVTPQDIQEESERIRREKQLERISDTMAWLEGNLLTPDDWEMSVQNRLLADKLARDLFAQQVESYFAQNRLDYEQFVIYQITVPYQKLAQEIFYQIEEEEISFYEAAHIYDIDQLRRFRCGYLGKMYRRNFSPEVAAAIFRDPLPIRQVVGPIQTEQGFNLFKIEEYIKAELTPELFQEILSRFFKQWLDNEINYVIHSQDNKISVTPEN